MACFIVPATEAIIVTVAAKVAKHHKKKVGITYKAEKHFPLSRKLMWLSKLLAGGSFLLAFEHVWHGEVVPWFPFLTATLNPQDTEIMLSEMGSVGVCMALLVTAVWGIGVLYLGSLNKDTEKTPNTHNA